MPLILDIEEAKKLATKSRTGRQMAVRSPQKAEVILRDKVERMWAQSVFPAVQRIKQAIKDGMNLDALAALMERELRTAEVRWGTEGPDIIDMWRLAVDRETRSTMHKSFARSLGVNISAVLDSELVSEALEIGSYEAANLIVTMPRDTLGLVQKAVMDNVRGIPQPQDRSLLEQINFLSGKENFKKHAKLIARDQTAKMTALLNQTRQQSLGVEMYIWRTARDQRVVGRPGGVYPKGNKAHGNHWKMEGKYCRWDDATLYSLDKGKTWIKRQSDMPKTHPGTDIQCRCFAEAVLEIDKILKNSIAA